MPEKLGKSGEALWGQRSRVDGGGWPEIPSGPFWRPMNGGRRAVDSWENPGENSWSIRGSRGGMPGGAFCLARVLLWMPRVLMSLAILSSERRLGFVEEVDAVFV